VFRCLVIGVLAWLAATSQVHAAPLVGVEVQSFAVAPPEPAAHLITVDDSLIAWGAAGGWRLAQDEKSWQRIERQVSGTVSSVAGDGHTAYLLVGADSVERVEPLLVDRPLPALPMKLASARAVVLGSRVWVAGFDESGSARFYELDTSADRLQWTAHDAWAGPSGVVTSAIEQTGAVLVTVRSDDGPDRLFEWRASEGWRDRGIAPAALIPNTSSAVGQAHVLYLASGKLIAYHTITGSWATLKEGVNVSASTVATVWRNGIVWLRTSDDGAQRLISAQIQSTQVLLKPLDWVMIIVYLVSMIGMGLYFYMREKRNSTSDFFVGGRSIPFWAAGVSLYAANTSSISYIAIPAKAFETNWQYLTNNLVAVIGLMFVAVWIVPLLRRLNLMSVFAYLETRFHPLILTGIDVAWSILIMGVFTMVYTALGGMKAVVWTDFVQLIVKMGGIVFAIAFIAIMMKGGVGEMVQIAAAENKTKLFDFSFDLTKATVWGFVFLVLFDVVLTFPKDQVLMQRVLSTESAREAGRSVWTFAAIMIPGGFMFYMVGTSLYAFYKTHPERLNPLLPIDSIFPLFIAAELPMGVRGLIIAGILAAAMATLSGIMNSVATLASVDFYEKWVRNPDPKVSVRFAEWMTIATGVVGMGLALVLSRYDIHSLFDVSIELAGLLGGGFAGAYTLGMFTRRANWQGVAIGIAVAIVLTTIAWSMKLVHPYFYLAISILLCICVGYVASLFFPAPSAQSLVGLTIYEPRASSAPKAGALMPNE
jgi:SSS family solute:Na+ symporter